MAFQAIGWLSSKLGVDIAGREKSSTQDQQQSAAAPVEGVMASLSNAVFGGDSTTAKPTSGADAEVDANGLPTSRDWYYYDEQKKRWEPTPHAPDYIKAEHAEKVKAAEEEALGIKKFPDPPPPPPPASTASPVFRSPVAPQYVTPSYFKSD